MHTLLLPKSWQEDPATEINRTLGAWFGCSLLAGASLTASLLALAPFKTHQTPVGTQIVYYLIAVIPVLTGMMCLWRRTRATVTRMPPRVPKAIAVAGVLIGCLAALRILYPVAAEFPTLTFCLSMLATGAALGFSGCANRCNRILLELADTEAQGEAPILRAKNLGIGTGSSTELRWQVFASIFAPIARAVLISTYCTWMSGVILVARIVRRQREPGSVPCIHGCPAVFDDPPLQCRCGEANLHTFPKRTHPLFAQCANTQCNALYPTWYPTLRLLQPDIRARFTFERCRMGCGAGAAPARPQCRILLIPFGRAALVRILRLLGCVTQGQLILGPNPRKLQSDLGEITLITPGSDERHWAGHYDVILVAASESAEAKGEIALALQRVNLPRPGLAWGPILLYAPVRGLRRLFLPPRDVPNVAPYPHRRTPRKIAVTELVNVDFRGFVFVRPERAELARIIARRPT